MGFVGAVIAVIILHCVKLLFKKCEKKSHVQVQNGFLIAIAVILFILLLSIFITMLWEVPLLAIAPIASILIMGFFVVRKIIQNKELIKSFDEKDNEDKDEKMNTD